MLDETLDRLGGGNSPRVGVAILAVAMAVGAASCGSDDGPEGNDGQARGSERTATDTGIASDRAATAGDDKAQIRRLLDYLQRDYIAGKSKSYCSSLTAAGRRQIADLAQNLEHGATCESFVTITSRMTREAGLEQKPTVVLSVRVNGDRAVATTSDGGRPPAKMVFVKHDGRWKLPDPGFKATLAGQGQPEKSGKR